MGTIEMKNMEGPVQMPEVNGAAYISTDKLIECRKVGKVFQRKKIVTMALEDVDFDLQRGEFVSLIGPSGCGKTTLLRIMAGLTDASAGSVQFPCHTVDSGPRTGFVFQDTNLLPWRTAVQNVEFGLEAQGIAKSKRHRRAMEALTMVGLANAQDMPPYTLSGGMQQRVGLARALAVEPEILFMDEPFGHLDSLTRQQLQIALAKLWAELRMAVVFVTHDIDEAIFLSTRIVVLSGSPGHVVDEMSVNLGERRWERILRQEPTALSLYARIRGLLFSEEIGEADKDETTSEEMSASGESRVGRVIAD